MRGCIHCFTSLCADLVFQTYLVSVSLTVTLHMGTDKIFKMGVLSMGGATLVNVTADMLTPVTTAITSNLGVLLPVGISIMAILIGVALIPRIIYKFF